MSDIIRPNCCGVSMWLIRVELGDLADRQEFQCMVCEATVHRTVPREEVRDAPAVVSVLER